MRYWIFLKTREPSLLLFLTYSCEVFKLTLHGPAVDLQNQRAPAHGDSGGEQLCQHRVEPTLFLAIALAVGGTREFATAVSAAIALDGFGVVPSIKETILLNVGVFAVWIRACVVHA